MLQIDMKIKQNSAPSGSQHRTIPRIPSRSLGAELCFLPEAVTPLGAAHTDVLFAWCSPRAQQVLALAVATEIALL